MLRERKWNYIFNLFCAETNYQEEKRGFICIPAVELVTSSLMELPPCWVSGDLAVTSQPRQALSRAGAPAGSFTGTQLARAVWGWDPHPLPLFCREERLFGGPCKHSAGLWHNAEKPDYTEVTAWYPKTWLGLWPRCALWCPEQPKPTLHHTGVVTSEALSVFLWKQTCGDAGIKDSVSAIKYLN